MIVSPDDMANGPAEFLVESLLADALLLGRWGGGAQVSTADSSEGGRQRRNSAPSQPSEPRAGPLTPQAELRRRRNRECMQRARQTQRENLERMRTTVQSLTEQLDSMLKTQAADQNATQPESTAHCIELTETTHRLKAENSMLEHSIRQHENTRLRLMDIMQLDNRSVASRDQVAAFPEFELISHAQAEAAIRESYVRIAPYKEIARPLSHWISDASVPSHTFGWTVTCALRPGSSFFLAMTKKLTDVTAELAMKRSWASMSKPRVTDKSPSQRLSQSVMLQTLDRHTCVSGNDWHHPLKQDVCMRSISVRTCRATEEGYAVSLGTLNPQDPEIRRRALPGVEFLDAWTVNAFSDAADESGCVASLKTLWHYDTHENLHMRLINALSTAWRWETEVMQYPMKLLKL